MEIIKQQIDAGNLSLAKMNPKTNQPQPIEYTDVERQRNNRQKMAELFKRVKELNWDQKYQWVTARRLRANALYKSGQIQSAMELYLQSMIGIDLQSPTDQQANRVLFQLKYPIMLNICSCMYKMKQFQQGVQICERILIQQQGKDYAMAIYKKGMCLIGLGQYQQARVCLKKLIQGFNMCKSQSKAYPLSRVDIQKMAELLKSKQQSQQQVFQRIFQGQKTERQQENALLVQGQGQINEEEQQKNEEEQQKNVQVLRYNEPILERLKNFCKQMVEDCVGTFFSYKDQ